MLENDRKPTSAVVSYGRAKRINQDMVYAGGDFVIVADGQGGGPAGEKAAEIAIDQVSLSLQGVDKRGEVTSVKRAMQRGWDNASRAMWEHTKRRSEDKGMGTTLVAGKTIWPLEGQPVLVVGWSGDSRGYVVRDNSFNLLTYDENYIWAEQARGKISEEDAAYLQGILDGFETTAEIDMLSRNEQSYLYYQRDVGFVPNPIRADSGVPRFAVYPFDERDRLFVATSDGVTDNLSIHQLRLCALGRTDPRDTVGVIAGVARNVANGNYPRSKPDDISVGALRLQLDPLH